MSKDHLADSIREKERRLNDLDDQRARAQIELDALRFARLRAKYNEGDVVAVEWRGVIRRAKIVRFSTRGYAFLVLRNSRDTKWLKTERICPYQGILPSSARDEYIASKAKEKERRERQRREDEKRIQRERDARIARQKRVESFIKLLGDPPAGFMEEIAASLHPSLETVARYIDSHSKPGPRKVTYDSITVREMVNFLSSTGIALMGDSYIDKARLAILAAAKEYEPEPEPEPEPATS